MIKKETNSTPINEQHILNETQQLLPKARIDKGRALAPLLRGFRGKQGKAVGAVYPTSVVDVYRLIKLYKEMNVGYLMQGANTALKGQGTPNGDEKNIMIIKTHLLNKIKVLDFPNQDEYKILLVQPGVALKDAEVVLNKINFSLPHRTGSHDLGNTFGASCANACGGVQVDNRDGRPSLTSTGNMGAISISAEGIIYNGFIKADKVTSGEDLLTRIDQNNFAIEDIELPHVTEVDDFLKKLFVEKSYPIRNHRGELIFPGDGGEGSQAVVYQMYLIRRKPMVVNTYALLFFSPEAKEKFYQEVIFSEGAEHPHSLPILCESMNEPLVKAIVNEGVGFFIAVLLASGWKWVSKNITSLMRLHTSLIQLAPVAYLTASAWIGKCLSRIFTPAAIRNKKFHDMLVLQVANHNNTEENIANFEKKFKLFSEQNPDAIEEITVPSGGFAERMILETRTAAAPAILCIALQKKGTLFPFDDAIMPGQMTHTYQKLLAERIKSKNFPIKLLGAYFYGHDLKQISHNEWVYTGPLTPEQIEEIYQLHLATMQEVGGVAHAEHGVGDHADTDLNRDELVKLVAHRYLNDKEGLANPGGGPEKAYKKSCQDKEIYKEGIALGEKVLEQEKAKGTLWTWEGKL